MQPANEIFLYCISEAR